MKNRALFLLLLSLVLMLPLCAHATLDLPKATSVIEESAFEGDASLTGVVELPSTVTQVGDRAFASTGLYGLRLPAGCALVGEDILADTGAAYLYREGADTQMAASALDDTVFYFHAGTACEPAYGLFPISSLTEHDQLYYYNDGEYWYPLCPIDSTKLTEPVVIPEYFSGSFVESLEFFAMPGCEDVPVYIPSSVSMPSGINGVRYNPLRISTFNLDSNTDLRTNTEYTFTNKVSGGIGTVTYTWNIVAEDDTTVLTCNTDTATLSYTFDAPGIYTVELIIEDSVGTVLDHIQPYTVIEKTPTYRALLIGNIYNGESSALAGPDNDVASMAEMLANMPGTPYSITSYVDINTTEMKQAIADTFSEAEDGDISLFYYSGHGTSAGHLCGTGSTFLHASELKECLDKIPGTKIVLLDCCYSGYAIEKSATGFNDVVIMVFGSASKEILNTNGYVVLTASSQATTSSSLQSGGYAFGLFTYGLCYSGGYDHWGQEWLGSMAGDTNGDQAISVGEAVASVQNREDYIATMIAVTQQVQYYGDENFILWAK